jgi:hypothetical protein
MLLKFIRLCIIFIIIGGGILIYNQPEIRGKIIQIVSPTLSNLPDVKGISTKRANNISNHIRSDIIDSIAQAQSNVLNLRVSDIINFVNGSQKIASDFRGFQDYIKEEANNYIKDKINNK